MSMCPQASSGYKRRTGRNGQSAYGFRSRSLTMLGSMRSMHHGPHAWLGTSHRTSVDRRDAHLTYRVQGAGTLRYRLKSSQAKPSQVDSIRFDSTSQQPGDTYGVQGTSSPPPHPPDGPCGGLQGTGPSRSLCTSASVSSSRPRRPVWRGGAGYRPVSQLLHVRLRFVIACGGGALAQGLACVHTAAALHTRPQPAEQAAAPTLGLTCTSTVRGEG